MQGGLGRASQGPRRPFHGGGGSGGYRSDRRSHTPYDRPSNRRIRSVKEAIETNVLLSKEHYLHMDDVSISGDSEGERDKAYLAYLESHRRVALERFFLGHKDEAWFIERHTGEEYEVETEKIKEKYAAFLNDLARGQFDHLCLQYAEDLDFSSGQEGPETTNAQVKNYPLASKLPERLNSAAIDRFEDILALSNIPPTIKKASIESLLRDSSEQFEQLFLTEPVYEKSLYRSGFAVFREGADLTSLALKLENILIEGCKIYYSVQKSYTRQIKLVGPEFGHAARITKDLALSSRLLAELCARYELEAPACVSDESKSDTLRLDLNLTCLRKVFSLCYYCGNACANSPDLYKQCGDLHLRSPPSPETIEDWDRLSSWLDVKVEDLIRFYGHPFELASEDNIIESKHVIKLDESRFRCSLCSKLFKGPEFVIKHVRLKHEEETNTALQQLALLNMFLARPSLCAFLKSPAPGKPNVGQSTTEHRPHHHHHRSRPSPPLPPSTADTRMLRRPIKQYVDWDAPAAGDVEINYD